jgi:hypothetical protein
MTNEKEEKDFEKQHFSLTTPIVPTNGIYTGHLFNYQSVEFQINVDYSGTISPVFETFRFNDYDVYKVILDDKSLYIYLLRETQ